MTFSELDGPTFSPEGDPAPVILQEKDVRHRKEGAEKRMRSLLLVEKELLPPMCESASSGTRDQRNARETGKEGATA